MNWEKVNNVYFIGIGGIGMSALATFALLEGKNVAGYDRFHSTLTQKLSDLGAAIHYSDNPMLIPDEFNEKSKTLVIYTPAISSQHEEMIYFREKDFNIIKRAAFLGMLCKNQYVIATSGTHGKTSITSSITWLLSDWNHGVNAFIGGVSKNLNGNFISAKSDRFVVEADEFDRSFLSLNPDIAIVTAIDPDHLDIYGNEHNLQKAFNDFIAKIKPGGLLIYNQKVKMKIQPPDTIRAMSYSVDEVADYQAVNLHRESEKFVFDILHQGRLFMEKVELLLPGRVNVENSLAAIIAAFHAGVPLQHIREKILSFTGVKRRFDFQINEKDFLFIDDYAHHPEEIKAIITTVREIYPDKKISVLFQPHLFTRTRDFAEGFAQALDLADQCFLLDIYPAREFPIQGVSSELIRSKMKNKDVRIVAKNDLINIMEYDFPQVFLSLGAGDIDQLVSPLKEFFIKKLNE